MSWLTRISLLAISVPAFCAPIVIDNFDDTQSVCIGPSPCSAASSATSSASTGSNSIGGTRDIFIERTTGSGFVFGQVTSGYFSFSLGNDSGRARIFWDGNANGVLDENGFAPVDLTDNGTNQYFIALVKSDLVAPIVFTIYSGTGNSSSVTIQAPAGGFGGSFTPYYIPFAAFAVTSGTGGTFSGVTAVSALLDGTNQPGVDIQLDIVGVGTVPEPGTFGLAGLVLTGLAYGIRRRR